MKHQALKDTHTEMAVFLWESVDGVRSNVSSTWLKLLNQVLRYSDSCLLKCFNKEQRLGMLSFSSGSKQSLSFITLRIALMH